MIVLDVQQGSQDWINARLGIPTASQFGRILTAKTRKPSASATKYLCELVAERIIGMPTEAASSEFMLRGSALEAEAVAAYEFDNDCTTTPVGFVLDDSGRWGCSPDRLVGDDGLLEIKCPSAAVHVAALLGMLDEEHVAQVQGQLWVTGRKWCDNLFYNPAMPSHTVRIYRDEDHIAALAVAVPEFCDRLDAAMSSIVGNATDGGSSAKAADTDGRDATAVSGFGRVER